VSSDPGLATVSRRCLISGRVQGVWFRGSTRQKALALGLDGWARNLADGRVEVVANGRPRDVDTLCAWLHEGPALARVDQVACEPWTLPVAPGFETR
jgi:acylphosphatase